MKKNRLYSLREYFVFAWLYFLLTTYISTEFLSFFFAINFDSLAIYYSFFSVFLIYFLYRKYKYIKNTFFSSLKLLNNIQIVITGIILLYILLLLFIGIYCPPNNWDSMTYHLGRVVHWQQNQNIEHYATHISRQLFNPPLVEYVQLHILILSRNDYFLNLIQLVSLIGCILTLSLIIKQLGYNSTNQIEIGLVVITIPMAILQATNTKNELTVAFLFIFSVYYLLKLYKNSNTKDVIILGIGIGLAFVTKSTSYIYLLPVLLVFFVGLCFKNYKSLLKTNILAIIIAILVASPVYIRNYKSYKNPLGATKQEESLVVNATHDWKTLVSNLSRNAFINLANVRLWEDKKIFIANAEFLKIGIENLHKKLDIDINNPKTTFGTTFFDYNLERDEDYVGNYFHFILTIFAFLGLLFIFKYFKTSKIEFLLLLSLVAVSVFFSIYLKWQLWHGRLHLPIFILSSIIISLFLFKINPKIKYIVYILLVLGSITYLYENNSKRVLFKNPKIFNLTRDQMMFSKIGKPFLDNLYAVSDYFKHKQLDTLGLIIGGDSWDYGIFKIIKKNNKNLIINHIEVQAIHTPQCILDKTPPTNCNYILSNIINPQKNISYNNSTYQLVFKNTDFSVYSNQKSDVFINQD